MEKLGEKLCGACPQTEDVVGKTPEEIFDLARGPFAEAVEELEKDDYIKNVLGGHITEKYLEAKKAEWADYRAQVTEWEIEKYLYKI